MKLIYRDIKADVHLPKHIVQYMKDINKYPMFKNKQEEIECGIRARNGCEKSREELVTRNLRFVPKVVFQYTTNQNDFYDMISEGNRGLIDASLDYDPDKNLKFISYAVWHIRRRIVDFMCDYSRVVKVSRYVSGQLKKVEEEEREAFILNEGVLPPELFEKHKDFYLSKRFDRNSMVNLDDNEYKDSFVSKWSLTEDLNIDSADSLACKTDAQIKVEYLLSHLKNELDREIMRLHFGLDEHGYQRAMIVVAEEINKTLPKGVSISDKALQARKKGILKRLLRIAKRKGIELYE